MVFLAKRWPDKAQRPSLIPARTEIALFLEIVPFERRIVDVDGL